MGSVDLLMCLDYLSLDPVDVERFDNLWVVSSFEKGLVLAGYHPSLKSSRPGLNEDVAAISHSATINRVLIKPIYEFFESHNLRVKHPRRCRNCKNCKDCSFQVHSLSLKEPYESQVIESRLTIMKLKSNLLSHIPLFMTPLFLPTTRIKWSK